MRLFLQAERRILGFILPLVPNLSDAEDLLQETCSIMWTKIISTGLTHRKGPVA